MITQAFTKTALLDCECHRDQLYLEFLVIELEFIIVNRKIKPSKIAFD